VASDIEEAYLKSFVPGAHYKKGDFIGQKYQVYGVLGKGGFGIVYLVYSHETKSVYALKTFRDEYLEDEQTRKRFRKEAQVWVDLERHPYLVRASFVDEISGRLYIGMEYIAPDEHGLNSLAGYLRRRPPDLVQSLRWAIQFCYGMEYAYSKGIRSHRDIKPDNIMVSQGETVKITDFGLAGVIGPSGTISGVRLNVHGVKVGLSCQTMEGTGFGTPTYMPPEQFTNAAGCDQRSDIYAFGVVLYQMASGGKLPFLAPLPKDDSETEAKRFWKDMYRLHSTASVPRLDSPLSQIIQHCLEKEPARRFQSFRELRDNLEPLLKHQVGEVIRPPDLKAFEAWEWGNKGVSFDRLGRYEDAIRCYDKVLELEPRDAKAWNNKGSSLASLGRYDEAIRCCDKALELEPRLAQAWSNKGLSLANLNCYDEAIRCCDKALELDPRYAAAWTNKGGSLAKLGRYAEATRCFDKALEINPQFAMAWSNKGNSLASLGRYDEAIRCYDKALELNPRDVAAWGNKGDSLDSLGRYEEAICCYDKVLKLDPRDAKAWYNKGISFASLGRYDEAIRCYDKALELNPRDVAAWYNKGISFDRLGRYEDGIRCYDKALEINPQFAMAWSNKGNSLDSLGRYDDAIRCYDKALELDPKHAATWHNKGLSLANLRRDDEAIRCYDKALELDPKYVGTWFNKALVEERLDRKPDAVRSYKQFIALAPAQDAAQIQYASKRLRELEGH